MTHLSGGHQPRGDGKPHGTPPNQGSGGAREAVKTLRDELAMAALTGLLASARIGSPTSFAKDAYLYADAALAARAEEPKP